MDTINKLASNVHNQYQAYPQEVSRGYGDDYVTGPAKSDAYGALSGYGYGHSGYGHSGHGGGSYKEKCCPLVIDTLCVLAILGAIAAATLFLNPLIVMNLGKRRRRRDLTSSLFNGESSFVPTIPVVYKEDYRLSRSIGLKGNGYYRKEFTSIQMRRIFFPWAKERLKRCLLF